MIESECSPHQLKVIDFMRRAGQLVPDRPTEPTPEVRLLRARLILEEAIETVTKGLGVSMSTAFNAIGSISDINLRVDGQFNMVELLDGVCDVSVVSIGTLVSCGISDVRPIELVDASNLAKFAPGWYRREDGKVIKPPDWKAPDLASEIERQRKLSEPPKQTFSFSTDEENYGDIFDTIDEAVQEGASMADEGFEVGFNFWVGECANPKPEDFWSADHWLEQVSDQDEFCSDWADGWDRSTREQHKELESEVRSVMARWLDRHNLRPKFYNINHPKEYVVTEVVVTNGVPTYKVDEVSRKKQ